jgi:hypothetical protein
MVSSHACPTLFALIPVALGNRYLQLSRSCTHELGHACADMFRRKSTASHTEATPANKEPRHLAAIAEEASTRTIPPHPCFDEFANAASVGHVGEAVASPAPTAPSSPPAPSHSNVEQAPSPFPRSYVGSPKRAWQFGAELQAAESGASNGVGQHSMAFQPRPAKVCSESRP